VGDGTEPPTLEEMHRNWEAVNDLSKGEEYGDATRALTPMLEAFDPKKTG
jgi:hypothetical protein